MSQVVGYKQEQRSFIVNNARKFTQLTLTKYFKHRNYSSFIRQLNLYDFHKIRYQAKEQIFSHKHFDINDLKQLKKIKRKKMQSQLLKKKAKKSKQMYSSQQEQQIPQESQQFQEEFSQNSEEQIQENGQNGYQNDNQPRVSATLSSIQQLQKKKAQLQRQIQLQNMSNQKLLQQNTFLLNMFYHQNNQFYKQILKILQQLLLSQYQISQLNKEQYDNMILYIYYEKEKFLRKELNRSFYNYNQNNHQKNNITIINQNGNFRIKGRNQNGENESSSLHMKYSRSYTKQSKLFSLIKQILLNNQAQPDIKQFILILKQYMERSQNQKNPSNNFLGENKIKNVVNYCFSIAQMEQSSLYKVKNEFKQSLEKLLKIEEKEDKVSSNKSQTISVLKDQKPVNSELKVLTCQKKQKQIKKRKRGRRSSDDEDYRP